MDAITNPTIRFFKLYIFLVLGVTVKPNKRNLSIIFLSIILIGIGLWLFHIDHYTYVPNHNIYICTRGFGTVFVASKAIPPPSYASLWPYMLALGIGLAVLIFRRK